MARSYDIAVLAQKVERLETEGIELPKVTSSDNGKVLQVVSGKWKKGSKMPDAVSANPGGEIDDDVTALQVGDDKYNIWNKTKVAISIPANTYNTYALALAAVEEAYDSLTLEEKLRSIVVRGDSVIFYIQNVNDKTFSFPEYVYSTGAKSLGQTIDLKNHTYTTLTNDNGTMTRSDIGGAEQGFKVELLIS